MGRPSQNINQQTKVDQTWEGPEEWWQRLAKERHESRRLAEPPEETEHQGRENRILEISGPDEEE